MRRVFLAAMLCLVLLPVCVVGASTASAAPAQSRSPQFVDREGALPSHGRVVIRSGLAWMNEASPLFALVSKELAEDLTARGVTVVQAPLSRMEELPPGTAEVRTAKVPELPGGGRGGRQRVMSVPEAAARMQAMHLSREGKLPRARFGNQTDVLKDFMGSATNAAGGNGTRKAAPDAGSAQPASTTRQTRPASAVPPGQETGIMLAGVPLTKPELIRFALSQEAGHPALRGHADIPGRLPRELHELDPDVADYDLVVKFAMLWPGARQKEQSALVAGWHLLLLDCYDLAPVRSGKKPRRIWQATVQRVVSEPNLLFTLPEMADAAVK